MYPCLLLPALVYSTLRFPFAASVDSLVLYLILGFVCQVYSNVVF